jgi:hypothetical protein
VTVNAVFADYVGEAVGWLLGIEDDKIVAVRIVNERIYKYQDLTLLEVQDLTLSL